MTRYDLRSIVFAAALSSLAGYTDAIGYLQSGGFFVSFMSGNSTQLGVGIGRGDLWGTATAGALVGGFVLGVMLGAFAGRKAGVRRRPVVLGLEALLLVAGAACGAVGLTAPALGATTLAMGVENAVFEREGEVSVGLTYMTGTLVKLGQRIVAALMGGPRFAWTSSAALWGGLVAGGILGTLADRAIGFGALWLAAAVAALAALATALDPRGLGRPE